MSSEELAGRFMPSDTKPQCVDVLRELAECGIRSVSLSIVFDNLGVGETQKVEYKHFKCGPFVQFKYVTPRIRARLERTLVSIATAGLRSSLGPHGLEVRNLSAVLRVSTVTGKVFIEKMCRCSRLREMGGDDAVILLRCQPRLRYA